MDIATRADDCGTVRKPWIRPLIESGNVAETAIAAKVGVVAESGTSIS
jgi:hypothetical protein